MAKLRDLWAGALPLGEAFWTWAVTVALAVNISTSVLLLAMLSLDRPWAALILGYAIPVPYNVVALIGVWRSADQYMGPAAHADLARAASLVILAILSLT